MDEFDAYAPPQTDVGTSAPRKKRKKKSATSGAIAEAITRLNEHLEDASAVAHDRKEAGAKVRGVTIGFVIFAVISAAGATFLFTSNSSSRLEPAEIGLATITVVFALIAVLLLVVDLRFLPRDKPASPEETLKHFFKAMTMGRLGYAWAALCPTAREQSVEPPALGPIPIGPGSFRLRQTSDLKDYTQTFARPGNGQMRTMQIKRATLLEEDGDVAVVEVTALFQAWPQWAQILSIIAFVIARIVGAILFLVLFFSLRKTHEVVFRKTLIRGSNGIWYVYSADLLEGASFK